jgi:soluble lytic murein transglycosylase
MRGRRLAALVAASWAAGVLAQAADPAPVAESRFDDMLEGTSRSERPVSRRYVEADFAPYFATGALAEAKALFDRRRYARARAMLRGEEPPVRFLRAVAGLRTVPAAAAEELGALARDYPVMRDHCLFHAAQALERLHKRRAAAAAYAEVSPTSSLYAAARLGRSRVLERALDLDGALEALQPLRDLPATPRNDAVRRQALLAAVRLSQKKIDFAGEHRAMLELWATSPLSREAESVWGRLRQLPIPNKWRLRRAEAFLAFHENEKAIKLALQVKTQLPDEHACAAAFVLGNALRKQRQHRRAIRALVPMVEACTTSELRPRAMYVLAYSQSVIASEDAARTYEALAREYPEHPFADDALFFAAELHLRGGNREEALERFELVASRHPGGNFAPEALFQLAWQRRKGGSHGAAIAALDRLERLPGAGREQTLRARYWRARVLAQSGDSSAAGAFAALAADDPVGWYGLLARRRIPGDAAPAISCGVCTASPPCAAPPTWPLEAGPLGGDPRFLAGVELLRMRLPEAAAEMLAVEWRGLPEDSARLLAEAIRRTGRDRAAAYVTRNTLGQRLTGAPDGRTTDVWEATYPRPFRRAVERWASASDVDPDLLQALMREESLFNPWARSPTGAIGLTQLMPDTARKVARSLKLGLVDEGMLQRPALNIRLGAAYLGALMAQLERSSVLAVAAYNAGPQAIQRWMRARPDADVDEWVEEIPVWETRDYVKRVLASYGAYRFLYGTPRPSVEDAGQSASAGAPFRL